MLIKELAAQCGLSVDTIRFYEKQGLLDNSHFVRTANGYRHYNEAGVQRLNLIKMGQLSGFTLSEMRHAIHAWETDELSPQDKKAYLCRKLDEIQQKIQALNQVQAYLQYKIAQMHEPLEAVR